MSEDREARRIIDIQSKQIGGLGKAISDAAVKAQKTEMESNQRKVVDLMSEIQGKMIDRAAAYTNLILIGGYAGIFTVWSNSKATLPMRANILVAGSVLLSLTVFIGFEIYKMIFTAVRFLKNRDFLVNPIPPDQFAKRLQDLQRQESKVPLSYLRLWFSALAFCILSALFAGGVLCYNFVAILLSWKGWPAD